jgi:lipid II:glycine glycyltransferase (peptidoglycan interpeptide bridge formation enzyme)
MLQYYHLHLLTRTKKHGMPSQPKQFFLQLWDRFATQQDVTLLLAEYEGQCIASMITLHTSNTIAYAYGASDERYLHLAPNNLLMWKAIMLGAERDCIHLDMGRTAYANEGLMEFKRRWGANSEPLVYHYYPAQAGLASTSEQSWKYRLLTTCWRKLPLQISAPLGGALYHHLG